MANSVIEVSDVCFSYGEQEVLHNVSFSIEKGTLTVVVGPNGGGKTTLLRLLMGDLEPTFGEVRVFGEAPSRVRARVGYVPQSVPFDPRFPASVEEVVLMGRVARGRFGFHDAADRAAADLALERASLAELRDRPFAGLSGGERQRVMIAQALAGGSEILLLDEPTANVDPARAVALYDLFSALTEHVTVMMVSHNLSVVTSHATHVLCVNRTADLHPIADVASGTVPDSGGVLSLLHHGDECSVLDASDALHSPHHGRCRPCAACTKGE